MVWNIASVRDEISLRKWSGGIRYCAVAHFGAGVSNTRATCSPRGSFVRPAMLFGIFK